jgi:hypothetical protein
MVSTIRRESSRFAEFFIRNHLSFIRIYSFILAEIQTKCKNIFQPHPRPSGGKVLGEPWDEKAALSGGTGRLAGLFGWQLLRNGAALDVGAVGIVAVDLGEATVHQHRNDHAALIQCAAIAGQYLFRFHQLSSMTQKPF